MGVWKRARVFNWELLFWISSLFLALIALGALLAYQSFMRAQGSFCRTSRNSALRVFLAGFRQAIRYKVCHSAVEAREQCPITLDPQSQRPIPLSYASAKLLKTKK
jgi:hypothetical protein